ncbi:MAG: DUF3334 family protein [Deltaproteobacteria bacterium]|nr:DUF3334 family protein [Deltaproteobacteria bacterium]
MKTIDAISNILCMASKEVLESSTGMEITFSETIQKIPRVHLKPEVGCFVLFSGDYSGLMIINFSAESALALYRGSMIHMGMPEDELAIAYTSDEVVDSIGEMINQIIGKVRRQVETQYGLVATNTQPKAIALNSEIILSIDGHDIDKDFCRRLSFKAEGTSFHIELSMEKTEFISLSYKDVHELRDELKSNPHKIDINDYQEQAGNGIEKKSAEQPAFDFDSLKKESEGG